MKRILTAALFWLIAFGLGSAVLASAGVYIWFGLGPSLICGAVYSFLFASIVFKGMADG